MAPLRTSPRYTLGAGLAFGTKRTHSSRKDRIGRGVPQNPHPNQLVFVDESAMARLVAWGEQISRVGPGWVESLEATID